MLVVPGPLDLWLSDGSVLIKNNYHQRNFFFIFICVNNVGERANVGEIGGQVQRKSRTMLVLSQNRL